MLAACQDVPVAHGPQGLVGMMALGALAVVLLFQAAFYLGGRRDRDFLLFGVYTLLVAVHTACMETGDQWLVGRLGLYALPGLHLAFLRRLFPDEVERPLVLGVAGASALTILAAMASPQSAGLLARPVDVLMLFTALAGLRSVALALAHARAGAGWMLGGSIPFAGALAGQLLRELGLASLPDMLPLGFVLFAVAFAATLALRQYQQEREMNRSLEDRVREQTREAVEAAALAQAANQAKSEFLALMSHEMRTPLHGWSGLLELLEQTSLTDRQRHYVNLLNRTADHLSRLVGDILDMARIEAGQKELDFRPFSPRELVAELAVQLGARAKDKHLHFSTEVRPGVPARVVGDHGALRQVLTNLLDNAIKFTSRGSVRLMLEPGDDAGWLRFTVADTGCGVPGEMIGKLFEPFTQGDPSSARSHEGSGLGLAICRKLVELMGGAVHVSSNVDEGSMFWVDVPLDPVEGGLAEPEPAPVRQLEPAPAPVASPCKPAPVPERPEVPRPGVRILFADDVELNRVVFRDFLEGTECVVDEAADGAEALALVEAHDYDVVVLDLRMPGMDGFEAAAEIRRMEQGRGGQSRLPLVALTAGAGPSQRAKAEEAGFDLFLAKPISRQALLRSLAELCPPEPGRTPAPPFNPPPGLEHLAGAFLDEVERDQGQLRALLDTGDRAQLAEFAHAVRGKCAMFGEEQLYQLLSHVEDEAATATPERLEWLVDGVVERVSQLRVYDVRTKV